MYIYTGRCIGRLPPTFDMIMNEHTHAFYAAFKPEKSSSSSNITSSRNRPTTSSSSTSSRNNVPRHHSHALTRSTRDPSSRSSTQRSSTQKSKE